MKTALTWCHVPRATCRAEHRRHPQTQVTFRHVVKFATWDFFHYNSNLMIQNGELLWTNYEESEMDNNSTFRCEWQEILYTSLLISQLPTSPYSEHTATMHMAACDETGCGAAHARPHPIRLTAGA